MTTMAPTRLTTELLLRRMRLAVGPAAAAEARGQVTAAIRSWEVPVEEDVAVLLVSELVTNAIRHEAGPTVTLGISCSRGKFRVEVLDTSRVMPVLADTVLADTGADAETGRGLLLVDTLSDEWGFYRTPAGKAVFFTLVLQADHAAAGRRDPRGVRTWERSPD